MCFDIWHHNNKFYVSADTENVSTLQKNRKNTFIYLLTIVTMSVFTIYNNTFSNKIIFGYLTKILMITPVMYKITKKIRI